jgi:hypothetical protein
MAVVNAERILPLQLAALGEGLAEGLIRELIVVDGGSRDRTLEVADAAGAVILHGAAGRTASLALGVAEARGEWLLVPAADSVLAPGWTKGLLRHLKRWPDKSGKLPAQRIAAGFLGRLRPGRPWLLAPQTLAVSPAAAMGRRGVVLR